MLSRGLSCLAHVSERYANWRKVLDRCFSSTLCSAAVRTGIWDYFYEPMYMAVTCSLLRCRQSVEGHTRAWRAFSTRVFGALHQLELPGRGSVHRHWPHAFNLVIDLD